jgi:hypothetical protein
MTITVLANSLGKGHRVSTYTTKSTFRLSTLHINNNTHFKFSLAFSPLPASISFEFGVLSSSDFYRFMKEKLGKEGEDFKQKVGMVSNQIIKEEYQSMLN